MPSGIGDFSVTAGIPPVPRDGKDGTPEPSDRPQRAEAEPGGPWRHFVCVVPTEFGLEKPVHGDTLDVVVFQTDFRLTVALEGLKSPDGLSFGAGITFTIGMEQVVHPEKILAGQPFLHAFREAVRLLDRCLGRKLSQPEFLSALNRIGLPADWRNELANGVFAAAPAGKARPSTPRTGGDAIDALLSSMAPVSGAETPPGAADEFASVVGDSGSGFLMNEAEARKFRDGLSGLLEDLERGLLDHPRVAGPMGLVLALHRLLKRIRGPKHLHLHLLPASMSDADIHEHWRAVLAAYPGKIEAWVYLTPAARGADSVVSDWIPRFAHSGAPILLQAAENHAEEWVGWGKTVALPAYVFTGGVAVAAGSPGPLRGAGGFMPAALAYLEALLENQGRLPDAASESLTLEDADVDPSTHSSADRVYDGETLRAFREKGWNVPVGAKNRSGVAFHPLASAAGAK